jgi:hypothetical protein
VSAPRPPVPRCGRRIGYTLTDAGLAALGPRTGVELAERQAVPYTLTTAGRAALDAWPGNRLDHEPRGGCNPCDGRGCQCVSGRWSR